ncbi:MAG: hypothetical protein LUH82_05110 [Clostridiales bacterium]|nr:hypothetical protein [Clostridiales bacterium]
MNISFNGFENSVATFIADGATKGYPVALSDSNTVVDADSEFIGVCVNTSGQLAGVQLRGYVEISYSGEAPAPGYSYLAADSNGGVMAADTGDVKRLIIKVDADNSIIGFIL